jgi:hypothetical protein
MVVARKRQKKEKDFIDQMLDTIDFRGLTQDEVVGRDGIIKQLTGRILQRTLVRQIISMYARGMSDREIKGHLEEIYNIEVSADLISRVTNAVLDEVSPPLVALNGNTGRWKNHRLCGLKSEYILTR